MALTLPEINVSTLADAVRVLKQWRQRLVVSLRLPAISDQGVAVTASVTAGDNEINHGLGATPAGWIVLRAQGTTGCAVTEVSSDDKILTLNATTSATLTLWVWP